MKRISILLIICVLSLSAFAQVQVYPLKEFPSKGVKYVGKVQYALPTTTLKVTVSVSKVQDIRGYFADYAESLLGLTNIIQQNRTYYKLNSVDIEPITAPDDSKVFVAYTSNYDLAKLWQEESITATDVLAATPLTTYTTHTATLPDFFKNYADISYTQQSETFVDTKIIDGVVTQVPASHTKTVSKSFESKAREAADAIVKSRKDQYNLAAGEQETPYSGEAMQAMLSELKKWENNYMSLFTGVSISDTMVYVFYITPEDLTLATAFYFNATKGFNQSEGAAADAYSLIFNRIYKDNITKIIEFNYPEYSYITRDKKPVQVSLTHANDKIHDFGVINMHQAGSLQTFHPYSKQVVGIKGIGFVF
ncbi:MAG: DUF4831 family protein [Bacteroidales bacterium]|nr:DUF4831 family protein [Bacteroidales bacterium]MBQ7735611.1 DUF4831 family protein [Bacteroidales bacterium]